MLWAELSAFPLSSFRSLAGLQRISKMKGVCAGGRARVQVAETAALKVLSISRKHGAILDQADLSTGKFLFWK